MATVSDRTWSEVLTSLRDQHPELVRPWFRGLRPTGLDNGVLQVQADLPEHHDYLTQHCRPAFSASAQAATGRLVTVHFLPPVETISHEAPLSFEAETEHLILKSDCTFENFVTGPCNRLPHAACVAIAESPGRVYNPLFIHGDVGLGKTHLLQAVCHQMKADSPGARILYISCETFTNHYIEAIERGALHQFRDRYRHVDALLIDDIQFLAARERSRDEFFHTFNTLFQSQIQIVLSADEPPKDIPSLEDRLISRFNWGLVARLEAPCLETRMAILHKKAKSKCIELPDDVTHYIAAHINSSIRELEGALTKLVALSQQYNGIIDLDVAREAMGEETAIRRDPTISDIMAIVTERYNVRPADLQSKRRNRSIAHPRQICMYLARGLTRLSLEEIGGYFGGRDHSTVLHAVRLIETQQGQNPELRAELEEMTRALRKS